MKRILIALLLFLTVPSVQLWSDSVKPGDIQMKNISILDGLSSSNVTCISSDSDRHLWVGTDDGFNIINNGHVFSFAQVFIEGDTLRTRIGHVQDMAVLQHKALIASESGLLHFDNVTGRYVEIRHNGRRMAVSAMSEVENGSDRLYLFDMVSNSIFQASVENGDLRLVRDFGENVHYRIGRIIVRPDDDDVLILADDEKGVFSMPVSTGKLTDIVPGDERIVSMSCIIDSDGRLWVSKFGKGLSSYLIDGRQDGRPGFTASNSSLPSDYVNRVLELTDDKMAVSTDAGVCIIDRKKNTVESVTEHEVWFSTALFSLSPLELIVGTRFNGIHEIRRTSLHFIGHSFDASGFSLPDEMIISALDGGNGDLWIGTAGGGIYRFNENDRSLKSFSSTQGNQITSICNLDDRNLLVVSRYDGFKSFSKSENRLGAYRLDCLDEYSRDRMAFEDVLLSNASDGSVLVFNLDGKCCRIKDGRGTVFQLFPENSIETILQVFSHRFTNVLVSRRRVYVMDNRDELWAKAVFSSNEDILSAAIDEECNVWFLTRGGVYRHILSTGETELVLSQTDDRRFVGIQCSRDQVWLAGRDRNIYCYSVGGKTMKAFTSEDGILPGNDFSGLSFKTSDACYFVGLEGVVGIVPSENPVPIRMKGFDIDCLTMAVDNKTARIEKGSFTLPKKYNRAILIFSVISQSSFTAAPFRYEIVDRSGHVITSAEVSNPVVSIGRLPSGVHSVRVSVFGADGWSAFKEVANIRRPNDNLSESLVVLVLSILLAALSIYLFTVQRKKSKDKVRLSEYMDNVKNEDRSAMAGFGLSLIRVLRSQQASMGNHLTAMLEHIKGNADLENRLRKALAHNERIDDWLDVIQPSEDAGKSGRKPSVKTVSIDDCLARTMKGFADAARKDGLAIDYVPTTLMAVTDGGYFLNAISVFVINAFINHARNSIRISSSTTNLGYVRVSVVDDGDSYPGDYDDLFSSPVYTVTAAGFSSMGLAAVRTRCAAIGCRVSGYRNVDQGGSTFYVEVPVAAARPAAQDVAVPAAPDVPEVGDYEEATEMLDVENFDTKGQTLLIVDDEPDVRDYLAGVYGPKFKEVYVASDGKEGLEIAREKQPSIIVSDVKMPRLNGFEFCKAVKSDIDISHLPFILLTSLAESKNQEIGYKMGADVFIPKPFDVKMLYNAIQTQLRNRYEIKKRYFSSSLPEITEEQTFSAADEAFVLKLNKFINDNIGNPDLNIDMILSEMCVSRSTLFNKMNSIIGVSAARYIKNIRVERAKKLLAKTSMSIFEVASEVGFTESQYFSTVFKQETGQTPSQYRAQNR